MNKILIFLVCLLILPFVVAQETPHRANTPFDLVVSSDYATNCNLTSIQYPNGGATFMNIPLNKNVQNFYLTINETNYSQTGNVCHDVICYDSSLSNTGSICRNITPNGEEPNQAIAFIYGILMFILIGAFALCVYYVITSDHVWVKAFGWGFGYLFLIGISFIAWNLGANFLTSATFLIEFLRISFLVLMIGFFPFILLLFVYGVYMMITIKEITDMIDRGIPETEAVERARWKK